MEQIGVEQQDVARLAPDADRRPVLLRFLAVCARDQAGRAVVRAIVVEEGERRNRLDDEKLRRIAMQRLLPAPAARLAAFDLTKEERPAQDMMNRRQYMRQTADQVHRVVKIDQRMRPIHAARRGPLVRGEFASVERLAEWRNPSLRNRAAHEQITLLVEAAALRGVEAFDTGALKCL